MSAIKTKNRTRKVIKPTKYELITQQKININQEQQIIIKVIPTNSNYHLQELTGAMAPNEPMERKLGILIASSLSTIDENNEVEVIIMNLSDHAVTIPRNHFQTSNSSRVRN